MIEVRRCLDPTNRYIPHLEQLLDVLANRKQIELSLLNDSMVKVQAELQAWRNADLSSVDSSDCENDIDDEIKEKGLQSFDFQVILQILNERKF